MSVIRSIKSFLPLQLILFYVFIVSGLICNFLQFCTLIIWPFNKKLYRKVNIWLAYAFWTDLTSLASYWSGSSVDVYMNPDDYELVGKEHAIVIMNHKYDIDWLMGWIVCQRAGLLAGSKIIGKATLRLIPLIGWCWLATESIFIKRQWETDKKKLTEGLDKILSDYPDDYFFNVLMFCEGTRFTQEKHDASMKVAREKGMPELKHHLLPRTKGFSMLNRGAAGRINAIYDLTIGIQDTDGLKPDLNSIRNGVPFKGELFVRRIPISEVPADDEGSAEFVHKMYREKDEIFDVYKKNGTFRSLNIPKIERGMNYYDLYISIMWCVLLIPPLFYHVYLFFQTATFLSIGIFFVVVFITSVVSNLFVRFSSSEKGSKYGKQAAKKIN